MWARPYYISCGMRILCECQRKWVAQFIYDVVLLMRPRVRARIYIDVEHSLATVMLAWSARGDFRNWLFDLFGPSSALLILHIIHVAHQINWRFVRTLLNTNDIISISFHQFCAASVITSDEDRAIGCAQTLVTRLTNAPQINDPMRGWRGGVMYRWHGWTTSFCNLKCSKFATVEAKYQSLIVVDE